MLKAEINYITDWPGDDSKGKRVQLQAKATITYSKAIFQAQMAEEESQAKIALSRNIYGDLIDVLRELGSKVSGDKEAHELVMNALNLAKVG